MTNLGVGSVIRITNFRHHEGAMRLGYKAKKGNVFVCLVLGVEPTFPKDQSELVHPDDVLMAMGWSHPEVKPKHTPRAGEEGKGE